MPLRSARPAFILIFILLMAFRFAAEAADNTAWIKANHPYALLESDTIDLGVLAQGNRASGQIRLTNQGSGELLIARVRSSCGLMTPAWPDKGIRTGKEAVIGFRYDTRRLGPFTRKVIIHTNAWQRTLVLTVIGEVVP